MRVTLFGTALVCFSTLAQACNEVQVGSVAGATACYVDPRGGSDYGIPVIVSAPCRDNEVLYLSFAYTFPGGSSQYPSRTELNEDIRLTSLVTRTETSANLGPASKFYSTLFTFPIPHSYFPNSAVVTETYRYEGDTTPALVLTTTKIYVSTLITTISTSLIISRTSIQYPTTTYPVIDTDTVIFPAQQTVTSTCQTGTLTKTAISSQTNTITYSAGFSITSVATTTLIGTQYLRCTQAGGGIPSGFLPRLGQYETEYCAFPIYPGLTTIFYTATVTSSTIDSILYYYQPYTIGPTTTTTYTRDPTPYTTTICNHPAATATFTSTRTRFYYTETPTTRIPIAVTTTTYATVTTASSVC